MNKNQIVNEILETLQQHSAFVENTTHWLVSHSTLVSQLCQLDAPISADVFHTEVQKPSKGMTMHITPYCYTNGRCNKQKKTPCLHHTSNDKTTHPTYP